MNFFDCTRIAPSELGKYGDPHAVAFYDYVVKNGGIIDHHWVDHAPYLTLCGYNEKLTYAPPLLEVGQFSGQRALFGDDWADNVIQLRDTPDDQLRKNAAAGYREALKGEPVIEEVDTIVSTPDGRKKVSYLRLISRVETKKGFRFFALFGTQIDRKMQ